jgi:hypothetical protein
VATEALRSAVAALKPYDSARKKLVRAAARVTVASQGAAGQGEEDAPLAQCLQRMKQALLVEERADHRAATDGTWYRGEKRARFECVCGSTKICCDMNPRAGAEARRSKAAPADTLNRRSRLCAGATSCSSSNSEDSAGVSSRVWCFLGGLSFLAELAHPVAALADTSTAPLWR